MLPSPATVNISSPRSEAAEPISPQTKKKPAHSPRDADESEYKKVKLDDLSQSKNSASDDKKAVEADSPYELWKKSHIQPRALALKIPFEKVFIPQPIFSLSRMSGEDESADEDEDEDREATLDDLVKSTSIIFPDDSYDQCCSRIEKEITQSDDDSDFGLCMFSTSDSPVVQELLAKQIRKMNKLKDPQVQLVEFLATIQVFGRNDFWFIDTEDDGATFKRLLAPLVKISRSIIARTNVELRIDAEGRRFILKSIAQFGKNLEEEPSPLFYDKVTLKWPTA